MGELQCFTAWRGEVNDRFDPHFYHPRFEKLLAVLRQGPHEILGNIAKPCHQKWNPEENPEDTFRYIEINSVSRETGDASFFKLPVQKAPGRAQLIVQKDDIIISLTRPHHGSIALINDDLEGCIASTGFTILREIKDPTLNRNYLYFALRSQFCLHQMLQRSSGGNYPAITTDQLMQILIPIPESNIQNHIVNFMRSAYAQKKRKEQEADALLDSIDDYILKELGIEMPEVEEKRCFVVYASETSGLRTNPFYYQNHYKAIQDTLSQSRNVKRLGELLQLVDSGSRPKGGVANIQSGVLSFGGEHINNQCEVDINTPRYVPHEFHNSHKTTETQLNDLLFVKDGATTGKIGIVSDTAHVGQNINEHLFILRTKDDVNPIYLLNYLNSCFGKLQIQREITGATVTGITRDVVKRLKIILPDIGKQTEIANHITEIRSNAKELQQEAGAIVAEAKERVERMLLQ